MAVLWQRIEDEKERKRVAAEEEKRRRIAEEEEAKRKIGIHVKIDHVERAQDPNQEGDCTETGADKQTETKEAEKHMKPVQDACFAEFCKFRLLPILRPSSDFIQKSTPITIIVFDQTGVSHVSPPEWPVAESGRNRCSFLDPTIVQCVKDFQKAGGRKQVSTSTTGMSPLERALRNLPQRFTTQYYEKLETVRKIPPTFQPPALFEGWQDAQGKKGKKQAKNKNTTPTDASTPARTTRASAKKAATVNE
jgi:hypothetical protein